MSGLHDEHGEILRAPLLHTPRNAFYEANALEWEEDGGLLLQDGVIAACDDFASVRAAHPDASVQDLRGGFLLPGFVDTHVHFPQIRVLGGLGRQLLDWLKYCALPEESRMADTAHAARIAQAFVNALCSHGTTTALVFGAHFASATAELFEAAAGKGLRVLSGLVLSDRLLKAELHQTPSGAYEQSTELIKRYHRRGRLLYAVTPRFALSASEAILEVCQTLLLEHDGLRFQTHANESQLEVEEVARLFPWAPDYLSVYERFGLCGPHSVIAHNLHANASELERLAFHGTAVSHCPASNFALGSGIFPLRAHLDAGVKCALGTDVGGGIGFGLLKEGLQAYMMQRIARSPWCLNSTQLLYLITLAGAKAVGLDNMIGDFTVGKAADVVYLRPVADSPMQLALEQADTPEQILSVLFTLAGAESVQQVRVGGSVIAPSL